MSEKNYKKHGSRSKGNFLPVKNLAPGNGWVPGKPEAVPSAFVNTSADKRLVLKSGSSLHGGGMPLHKMTKVSEAKLEEYRTWAVSVKGRSPMTVRTDITDLKFMSKHFSILHPTQKDLQQFIAMQKSLKRGNKTINNEQYALLYFQEFLGKKFTIYPQKKQEPAEQRVPEDFELKTLHDYIESIADPQRMAFLRALVAVHQYTGAREGEIAALTLQDILQNGIYIHAEKQEAPRTVRVSPKAIAIIRDYAEKFRIRSDQRALFTGPYGRLNSDSLRIRIKRVAKAAGVPFIHSHSFRHWFATTMYIITKDVREVQYWMGHKDIKSTLHYIHANIYELGKESAPLLDAYISSVNAGKFDSNLRANTTIRGEGESNPRSHRETA